MKDKKSFLINHLKFLESNYGFENAQKIVARHLWIGEKECALFLSLGEPDKTLNKVLKTKIKDTHYYYPINNKSYGLKIYMENKSVIGWEIK